MKKWCVLLALVLALGAALPVSGASAEESAYEQTLFDRSKLIEIDIRMSEEAWNAMIKNASSEEYNACDLTVNGELYENVAIRPKGNSSLSSVTSRGSERYSWRIKFDKYEKKRTCDGLDILILNNGFKDPGQLREALAYDMYDFLDADASLYNFAVVSVNGKYFGTYLALEGVDKSFAKRNYGKDHGELYKPDITNKKDQNIINNNPGAEDKDGEGGSFGGSAGSSGEAAADGENNAPAAPVQEGQTQEGNDSANPAGEPGKQPDSNADDNGGNTDRQAPTDEKAATEGENPDGQEGDGGSFGGSAGRQAPADSGNTDRQDGDGRSFGGSSGARSDAELAMALNYVGDDLETYQDIWDATKFKSEDEDHVRVVEALKHVCQGDRIADYLDVDNVLKYFAIQTFIYNHDGLTGNVTHNYYLYEENGKLNLIPWDMNEAFTVSGNGSDYVNFPIDTPFTVSDLSERSFFMALLADEECLAKYHEYLRRLSEEYALGSGLEATLEQIRGRIDTLVETDPTAFSSYEEYVSAANSLKTAIQLRAQSVLGHLSVEIPSTRDGQSAEPEKLLDTSGADFSGLTGGAGMGIEFQRPGR